MPYPIAWITPYAWETDMKYGKGVCKGASWVFFFNDKDASDSAHESGNSESCSNCGSGVLCRDDALSMTAPIDAYADVCCYGNGKQCCSHDLF